MSTSGGLQDFGTDIPINLGVNIPRPQIIAKPGYYIPGPENLGYPSVSPLGVFQDPIIHAYWEPQSTTADWASQVVNPRYFLYRKARSRKKSTGQLNGKRWRWGHPVHHNGVNYPGSHMFGGTQYYTDGTSQVIIPDRETEWDIALTPYTTTLIGLNPGDWYGYFDGVDFLTRQIQFPVEYNLWGNETVPSDPGNDVIRQSTQITGQSRQNMENAYTTRKHLTFCLKIVCENPNWDGTPNTQRFFIGPASQVFMIKPIIMTLSEDPANPNPRPQFQITDYLVEWRVHLVPGLNNT